MANFWNSKLVEPKRSFRFILTLNNIPTYVVKTSGKPSFTINNLTHSYVQHTFNYPGKVTWNPVAITLVDPVFPDASAVMVKVLQASGYAIPASEQDARISVNKSASVDAFGQPRLVSIDADGNPIERWTLWNAWIESVNFGTLGYENDTMIDLQLSIRYDWAEYEGNPANPQNPTPRPVMTAGDAQLPTIEKYRTELGDTTP